MTARRDSDDEPEAGSSGGRALLIGAVVFALAATGLLVLADELRWLRLGIVAALWAALVGAFLAAKYRRQLSDQKDALAERQELYELELEREIAARREYELEVAAEAKRVADEEARDDIAALRGELQSLRTTLESLLGGEFLVERYALRAESTRMRSLPDDRQLKRLPPAVAQDEVPSIVREAETDLIERIREVHQAPRREPQRPQHVEPRPAAVSQPMPKPPVAPQRPAAARTDRPAPEPVAQARRVEPPPHPAEVSDRWFIPGALDADGSPLRQPTPPPPQPAYDRWEPELSEIEEEWTPSWESANQARRHEQQQPRRPDPIETGGHARPEPNRYAQPADSGRRAREDTADSGRYATPAAAADSGRRAREDSADSGRYAMPADSGRRARQDTADSGQFAMPAAADAGRRARQDTGDSGQFAMPAAADSGRRARQDTADAGRYAVPAAAAESGRRAREDTADSGRRARQDIADSGQFAVPADFGRRARQDNPAPAVGAEAGRRARQDPADSGQYAVPADAARRANQETELAMRPVQPPAPTHDTSKPVGHQSEQTSWLAQYNQPKPPSPGGAERPDPLDYRSRPYRTHAADSGQFPVVDDLPPSGRRHARTEPEGDSGGGRRRRAEGQPTWQELQSGGRNGHARPEPVEEPTGSHAAGRSVNELLATHGVEPSTRRRRRREE